MAKKKKKRVIKVKNVIILLGLLLLICWGGFLVLRSPIKNIYISGNEFVDDNEILALTGLDQYPSFLLVNRFKIKNKLIKNKYVDEVIVRKKYGNVIELEIAEYKVIAKDMNEKIILSSGIAIENMYNIDDVPRLVSSLSDGLMKEFADKFSRINNNILKSISEIEYSPVSVDDDRFLLYMNDGNFVYVTLTKIDKVNKYNEIRDVLMGKKGVIYLDSGNYVELKS